MELKFTFQQDNNLKHKAKTTLECSWVAELQFWLKSPWKYMARPENGYLAIINNQNNEQMLKNKK
jgi:hypothetical protein